MNFALKSVRKDVFKGYEDYDLFEEELSRKQDLKLFIQMKQKIEINLAKKSFFI